MLLRVQGPKGHQEDHDTQKRVVRSACGHSVHVPCLPSLLNGMELCTTRDTHGSSVHVLECTVLKGDKLLVLLNGTRTVPSDLNAATSLMQQYSVDAASMTYLGLCLCSFRLGCFMHCDNATCD